MSQAGDNRAGARAEQALRATEERLRHLVEHAQDLIYSCDPAGTFTYVNPATATVLKFEPRELVGTHFQQLIRPDYQPIAGELHARQLRERIPTTYLEFPVLTKT